MKYLTQFLRIAAITLVGELLQRLIPLPVPASVYGLILLYSLCGYHRDLWNGIIMSKSFQLSFLPERYYFSYLTQIL